MSCKHKPQNATILRMDERGWPYYRFSCFCGKDDICRYCCQPIHLKRRWFVKILTFAILIASPCILLFPVRPSIQWILDIFQVIYLLGVVAYFWKGALLFRWTLGAMKQGRLSAMDQSGQSGDGFHVQK